MGFTLVELMVASVIGLLTAGLAGEAMISHLRTSEKAEAMEQQRSNWSRTTGFIEAEIALSERAIASESNIRIASECLVANNEFRIALDLRRDLPPVIYSVRASEAGWLGANTLWRCGPSFNQDGSYNATLARAPLVDGLDGSSAGQGGFFATTSADGKKVSFTLSLKGRASIGYSQQAAAHTRISPLYFRPTDISLCAASNMVKLEGRPDFADTLAMALGEVNMGEDILICGHGGGDHITGSEANDILESGDTGASFLYGLDGNDWLRGTNDADLIEGGNGDDVLVGRGGNDTLNGGSGQNRYLPGLGLDTVNGGSDLDIVFFPGNKAEYTISSGCSKGSCSVDPAGISGINTTTMHGVEILIFKDARYDMPD